MHVNIMILYNYIYICMYVCMYITIYIYTQAGAFRIGIGFLEGLLKRVSLKAP